MTNFDPALQAFTLKEAVENFKDLRVDDGKTVAELADQAVVSIEYL